MYAIEDKHETEDIPMSVILNDYHPLTEEEVKGLLIKAAIFRNDLGRFCDIQSRLIQGIPGMLSPRKVIGAVAKKEFLINSAFQTVNDDNIDELTDYITKIYELE